jgi:hypothetical protein
MKRRVKTISRAGRTVARVAFGSVREIRRALTIEGDIRSDVEFQNDVNAILAIIGKLTALGPGARQNGEKNGDQDGDGKHGSEDIAIEVTPLPETTVATPPPVRARRDRRP